MGFYAYPLTMASRDDVARGLRAPSAETRIVVADRTVIARVGIRSILERSSSTAVVAEAASYEATLMAVDEHAPDVLVIDLDLGDDTTKGLNLCEEIIEKYGDKTKILVIARTLSEFILVEALRRGASGFLIKDQVNVDELQKAVKQVQQGETVLGGGVSSLLAKSVGARTNVEPLSDRELEVLRLVGAGLGNKEIARKLYISESTVKFHVHNICSKFNCTKRTEVIHKATQAGVL